MREDFLYYIWRHQLFTQPIQTISGKPLTVMNPGFRNAHDGPDFKEAQVLIDGLKWYGAVEIHVKSSDWYRHGHHQDENYDTVVLHVVYEYDKEVFTTQQELIPTMALKGYIKPKFYERYQLLIENPAAVPCATQLAKVPAIKRLSMAERVLVERLQRKSALVLEELTSTNGDWQEVTFRMIARAMGFKANDEAMLLTARKLQYRWIRRLNRIEEFEGLLLGTAGFLHGQFKDEEVRVLQMHYEFFKSKYQGLSELPISYWKFAPLRPQNQPVQRLVQFAAILYQEKNLWDRFLIIEGVDTLMEHLQVELSSYWQSHLRPDKPSQQGVRKVSRNTVRHLLINVTAPMLAAYAMHQDQYQYMDRAVNILTQLSPEHNRVTRLWKTLNWSVANAFDSQAVNELFQQYCTPKKCLDCHIGVHLLDGDN